MSQCHWFVTLMAAPLRPPIRCCTGLLRRLPATTVHRRCAVRSWRPSLRLRPPVVGGWVDVVVTDCDYVIKRFQAAAHGCAGACPQTPMAICGVVFPARALVVRWIRSHVGAEHVGEDFQA